MAGRTAERLQKILEQIDEQIGLARECGSADTVFLLQTLKLHLKMKLYGISDEELRSFYSAVEVSQRGGADARALVVDATRRFGKAKRRSKN